MVVPNLGHITFVLVVECHEILYGFRTAGEVDVCVVRQGEILEHLFLPVNIWIAFCLAVVAEVVALDIILCFDRMILIAEIVDEALWTIVGPRSIATNGNLMLNGLVAVHIAIVRVILAREL